MTIRVLGFVFTMLAGVVGLSVPAAAMDGVLYEVTESVKLSSEGGHFRSAAATLTGRIAAGTSLCPTWVAVQLNIPACGIIVRAIGRADDVTGIGPASGEFEIVVQDGNLVDPPETVVMRGRLRGTIDLSPAFEKRLPTGSIRGGFSASGLEGTLMAGTTAHGGFRGTFRLPFMQAGRASYLMDDGSVVAAQPDERSLGLATVRLEIQFTTRASEAE